MPDRMSDAMSKYCIGQRERQLECQNKFAICTSRWYGRNYVRIVFQGWGSLEESKVH